MGKRWVCATMLILLTGCAAGPSVSQAPPSWIEGHGGLVSGTEAQRAQAALDRLASLVNQAIYVHVLDSAQAGAWSWPGGHIYLTAGLIRILDDDELTAVIGHEMGHLLRDHHLASTVALTGSGQSDDAEIAADAVSIKLLRAVGLPPQSMRLALHKLIVENNLDSNLQLRIQDRIDLLP